MLYELKVLANKILTLGLKYTQELANSSEIDNSRHISDMKISEFTVLTFSLDLTDFVASLRCSDHSVADN